MGNVQDSDLGRLSCSCIQKEEGCFMDFFTDLTIKDPFNFETKSTNNFTSSELQQNIPGGIHYPNDSIVKSSLKKKNNIKNNNNETPDALNNSNRNINEKENDLKEFDKKTDYFQLVNQINNTIKELKSKIFLDDMDESKMSSVTKYGDFDFKKLGKKANKILFNDIILCIKKIYEIHSEVILLKEKIFLGIVSNFQKEKKKINLINYEDTEKIVSLPNYEDIEDKIKLKLGENNNNKFKFSKFNIKGSFPCEILIWNLISQNTQKIADILSENYFCCIVLLYYSKAEEENETILYLINKPNNI
jgi:hypothetical protein